MYHRISLFAAFTAGALVASAPSIFAGEPPSEKPETTGTVVGPSGTGTRVSPNGKATVTFLARGENAFLARMEMEGGASVPEHRDETEEYIVVLQGSGTLTIEGQKHVLEPGSAVFMPADTQVSYQNGDERLVALQVFSGPAPASKYDAWSHRADQ